MKQEITHRNLQHLFDRLSLVSDANDGEQLLREALFDYLRGSGERISITVTVEICDQCEGEGFFTYEPENRNDDWEVKPCSRCGGKGRMRAYTTKRFEDINVTLSK